jgi:hypothetical protein
MALVTLRSEDSPLTRESAAKLLGVEMGDIDPDFDVLLIDPSRHLYSVRVRADHLPADFSSRDSVDGPFADVPIEPFGPAKR